MKSTLYAGISRNNRGFTATGAHLLRRASAVGWSPPFLRIADSLRLKFNFYSARGITRSASLTASTTATVRFMSGKSKLIPILEGQTTANQRGRAWLKTNGLVP